MALFHLFSFEVFEVPLRSSLYVCADIGVCPRMQQATFCNLLDFYVIELNVQLTLKDYVPRKSCICAQISIFRMANGFQ